VSLERFPSQGVVTKRADETVFGFDTARDYSIHVVRVFDRTKLRGDVDRADAPGFRPQWGGYAHGCRDALNADTTDWIIHASLQMRLDWRALIE